MYRRHLPLLISVLFLLGSGPSLFSLDSYDSIDSFDGFFTLKSAEHFETDPASEYQSSGFKIPALITGAALGAGVITVYSLGPYTGFDFKDHPGASSLMVGTSTAIMMSTSILHSNLLARSIYTNQNSILGGTVKGLWTGALAGGLSNGLSFATMLGIGVSSDIIHFNDPSLNTGQAILTGFAGGFIFGATYGAVLGGIEGLVFAAVQKKNRRNSPNSGD